MRYCTKPTQVLYSIVALCILNLQPTLPWARAYSSDNGLPGKVYCIQIKTITNLRNRHRTPFNVLNVFHLGRGRRHRQHNVGRGMRHGNGCHHWVAKNLMWVWKMREFMEFCQRTGTKTRDNANKWLYCKRMKSTTKWLTLEFLVFIPKILTHYQSFR